MLNRRDFLKVVGVMGVGTLPMSTEPTLSIVPNPTKSNIPSLDAILSKGEHNLITIVGLAGSGKTSLSHEIVLRCSQFVLYDDVFPSMSSLWKDKDTVGFTKCYMARPHRLWFQSDLILSTKKVEFGLIEVTVLKNRYGNLEKFRVRPVIGKGLVEV